MTVQCAAAQDYLQMPPVFADLLNYALFDGQPKVQPLHLRAKGTQLYALPASERNRRSASAASTDLLSLLCMEDDAYTYLLICLDHTSGARYAMPVRCLYYHALYYRDQIRQINRRHRQEKSPGQTACRFTDQDRLRPCITLVLYLDTDRWDASRCLRDILAASSSENLLSFSESALHLIEPAAASDAALQRLQSDLRETFIFFRCAADPARLQKALQDPRFATLSCQAAVLLNTLLNLQLNIPESAKGGTFNMTHAFHQLQEEARRLGQQEAMLHAVRMLMQNMNLDETDAMDALSLPPEQREPLHLLLQSAARPA